MQIFVSNFVRCRWKSSSWDNISFDDNKEESLASTKQRLHM